MEPTLDFPFQIAAGENVKIRCRVQTVTPGPYSKQLHVIFVTPGATCTRTIEVKGTAVKSGETVASSIN